MNEQVDRLVDGLRTALGDNIVGIYLHGSLALGCFNPERSDVDVLVVTERPLSDEELRDVAQAVLHISGEPSEVELSVLAREHLHPWRHPAPYDFHFSEGRRAAYERGEIVRPEKPDPDLAAHVSVARRAGVALHGPPPEVVLPAVPHQHYADAMLRDLEWTRQKHPTDLYGALSPARVWAGISEPDVLHTKESAAEWALERVPPEHRPMLEQALAVYRGERSDELDPHAVRAFGAFVAARLEELGNAEAAAPA